MPASAKVVPPPASVPGLTALFMAFARVSLVSVGGGVSAMLYREVVLSKRWVTEADFVSGLSLCQTLPGSNVTNLSIWIGYQLRGPIGAIVACLATIVPGGVLVIALGSILHRLGQTSAGALLLAGIAVSALGLSLYMGLRTTRFALRDPICVVVFAAALCIALLHGSVVLIIALLAPLSVFLAWWQIRNE